MPCVAVLVRTVLLQHTGHLRATAQKVQQHTRGRGQACGQPENKEETSGEALGVSKARDEQGGQEEQDKTEGTGKEPFAQRRTQ
jgi:hypothetical protein